MIKQILGALFICLFVFSCAQKEEQVEDKPMDTTAVKEETPNKFGVAVDESKAITLASLSEEIQANDSVNCVVKGEVEAVCQKKGCWMTLKKEDGSTVRVTFKDYALFMPKDLAGKEVVLNGVAKTKTVSVDMLKHLAEDEGKSQAEIDAITEEETKLAIEADGVVIKM
ncbi:MAG: DUF4920 domain-containing protein [Flammeovirgaceae bacterium]